MPPRSLDFTALTAQIPGADIRAFRSGEGSHLDRTAKGLPSAVTVIALIVMGALVVTAGALVLPEMVSTAAQGGSGAIVPSLLLVFFAIVLVTGSIAMVRAFRGDHARWERWLRLTRFAESNDLTFTATGSASRYPGAIFTAGDSGIVLDRLQSESEARFDYGNYHYETGSGKNRKTHRWGYLALRLDRTLPHMVLDAKANNAAFGSTSLPALFSREQRLSLEGDFDRYFTLYCPRQYERDALYVFTPDLMALCIDEVAAFDVEIVDDWMFVYATTPLDMLRPAVHQRMLRIVDTVGAKALTRTVRYRDERIADAAANVVAPQGARLTTRVPVWIFVTIAAGGVIVIATIISEALGA